MYGLAFVLLVALSSVAQADDGTVVHLGITLAATLKWVMAAFSVIIAFVLVGLLVKGLKYLGIQISDAQRNRLQEIIVNGLNDAASKLEDKLKNNPKLDVDVKNKIVADTVVYTQVHGADLIKALGLDPQSGAAVEAIKARIATAITDPGQPTPAIITQPLAPKK